MEKREVTTLGDVNECSSRVALKVSDNFSLVEVIYELNKTWYWNAVKY